ncbi:MAG: UvrD-helicase domain-containing protein [Endomicrobiaceae bacterium]
MTNKQISDQFIVVEASAGSGKTHNLAKRYITLLLDFDASKNKNIPFKNILALTFANKASVEMKERIIEYLKKISLKQDVGDLLSDIKLPKDKISQNANIAMNVIIEHYDNFNVKTIDSFINLIIKACALKIGLSPNYQIEKNYKDYIDFAIDSFLDNSLISKKLEKLLNDFFEQYLVDAHLSWDIKANISQEFVKLYEDVKKSAKHLQNGGAAEYKEVLTEYSGKFFDCCCNMTKIKEFENIDKRLADNILKIAGNNKKYLLTNKTISAYFKKEQIPYRAKMRQNEQLDNLFFESRKILKNFYEFKAFNYYEIYMQMFDHIVNEFDKQSKIDSIVFLQDLNRKVLKIFNDDSDIVPEIYFQLSSYFKDFLIDEFQDTNQIQWKTLKLIVEENLSQGGSFFYVGDKKQAIYGFRGGDSRIFDRPLLEFGRYNPKRVHLDTNYRSYKAIIDFNNSVFSKENISRFFDELVKDKDVEEMPQYFHPVADMFETSAQKYSADKSDSGYVEISTIEYADEDKEESESRIKEYLYKTIDSLKERFEYKDITVICRDNNDIAKIGQWLLEKNIDIESFQTLNIINSDIVKELFSVLKFLNSPTDEISFVSFLLSSFFLFQTKLSKEDILKFITENSLNKNREKELYVLFRDKYQDIWQEYIEPFFNTVGFVAVYELLVSIISKYNLINNFQDSSNVILRFLEVVSVFESQEQGLQNFIDYFQNTDERRKDDDFFIKVPSSDAIRIITAHKAKGLQFNVVIMPYLSLKFSAPEKPFNIQDDRNIKFLNISKQMLAYSDKLSEIYYKKYFKNLSDELNVLYVAMTRAVCEFYGLIMQESSKKRTPINKLLPDDSRRLGGKMKYNFMNKKEDAVNEIFLAPMKDFTGIISESAVEIYGKEREELLLKGKIIHYALSLIYSYNKENLDAEIKKTLSSVSLKYPNESAEWLEPLLKKLLSDNKISALFDGSKTIYNEKEFVDSSGNTFRIDKLITDGDKIIIVDFKTSIYDYEIIKKQMQKYVSLISEIFPAKEVKCFVVNIEKTDIAEMI